MRRSNMKSFTTIWILLSITTSNGQIVFPGSDFYDKPTSTGRLDNNSGRKISGSFSGSSCSSNEVCRPPIQCSGRIPFSDRKLKQCQLGGSGVGLCCPIIKAFNTNSLLSLLPQVSIERGDACDVALTNSAFSAGEIFFRNITNTINTITTSVPRGSSSFFHSGHQRAKAPALDFSNAAIASVGAFLDTATARTESFSPQCFIDETDVPGCQQANNCNFRSKYRNPDGSCNNIRVPKFGMVFTTLQRILRNAYHDGIYQPRVAADGKELISSRKISLEITDSSPNPSSQFTVLLMTMGQFLDHDMTHVPVFQRSDGTPIDCCASQRPIFNAECLPIPIPPNDPSFSGRVCLNFVRSLIALDLDCIAGPAQQQNQLTHWLDASNIYGSTEEEVSNLRSFKNGLLKMSGSLLPSDLDNEECINPRNCFLAGDSRVNEQPTLAVLHTIWVRQHNQIANALLQVNPSWRDENLFQETRRIITAQWQHIIYNEWLPLILGQVMMKDFGLVTLDQGFSLDYRDDFDPRVTNEFASAAFRFGHTLIPGFIKTFATLGIQMTGSNDLRQLFNDPSIIKRGNNFDQIIKGMTIQPSESFDNSFADDITEHLFERNGDGLDLIALNIQRSRDHGIPGYIFYREVCGLGKVTSFNDLRSNISPEKIRRLKNVYENVEDIDLFAGMIMENQFRDAFVGRTFLCIIADQFARLKKGDRYFYDLGGQAGSFTAEQLNEIRKTSFARILCDNGNNIEEIQPSVLEQPNNQYNKIVSCNNEVIIPKMNLRPWADF